MGNSESLVIGNEICWIGHGSVLHNKYSLIRLIVHELVESLASLSRLQWANVHALMPPSPSPHHHLGNKHLLLSRGQPAGKSLAVFRFPCEILALSPYGSSLCASEERLKANMHDALTV